ncbi:hypothetical protein K432DRAFT_378830 [Lepidopterella palustris CBS 459.81]|uniref:Myb-like domain-containing protein n=1 Tax=Lepidopterella palustris CBS 459.81 TaxID=1314670 RepID=A0A8E2JJ21_9PEZI|nr:hypothetical protein K432DRAFT_378830 [Lepidopterella palustris CBS 459.81]
MDSEAGEDSEGSSVLDESSNANHHNNSYNESESESSKAKITDTRSQSRKRKRTAESYCKVEYTRLRTRLRGAYNDEYRNLFNSSITDAANRFGFKGPSNLPSSQVGVSRWNSQEKEVFFHALGKLGRDDLPGISQAIGSKSEMEVREYLLLLQDGYIQQYVNEPRRKGMLGFQELPAAVELSEKCYTSLDLAGEALAWMQKKAEAEQEKKKFGDYWLLHWDLADDIEATLAQLASKEENSTDYGTDQEEQQAQPEYSGCEADGKTATDQLSLGSAQSNAKILKSVPAARLLKLKNWIELSRTLFMNSGMAGIGENWQDLADYGEEPSMYNTAFEDFHRLTVSVTQRIVQAAIFQAMSRLRANDWRTAHSAKPDVTKRDVLTAIDILGMKRDSKSFWLKTARRCGVQVYANSTPKASKKGNDSILSYDEVEEILGEPYGIQSSWTQSSRTKPVPGAHGMEVTNDELDHYLSQPDASSQGYDSASESDLESGPKSSRTRIRKQQFHENENDEHAELFDRQASRLEEELLWDILGQDPPASTKVEEHDPRKARTERKEYDDLIDWRNWTNYHPEWEAFSDTVREEELMENRRRRAHVKIDSEREARDDHAHAEEKTSNGEHTPSEIVAHDANPHQVLEIADAAEADEILKIADDHSLQNDQNENQHLKTEDDAILISDTTSESQSDAFPDPSDAPDPLRSSHSPDRPIPLSRGAMGNRASMPSTVETSSSSSEDQGDSDEESSSGSDEDMQDAE